MMKILICDDEAIVIESIKYILQKNFSNIEIETASTGVEALQKLIFQNFHLAFIDIQMPDMSGIEVMEEYRKIRKENLPFFVIISAHDKFEYARKSVELGAYSYILKPYSIADIVDVTRKAFDEIDKILSKQLEEIERKKKIKAMQSIIENGFAFLLLNGKLFSDFSIKQLEQILDVQSLKSGFVAIVKISQQNAINSIDLLNDIKNELKSAFSHRCVISFLSANSLLCIFTSEDPDYKNALKDRILKIAKAKVDSDIEVGISSLSNLYEDFEDAFYESYSNLISESDDEVTDLYLDLELLEKKILNVLLKTSGFSQVQDQICELIKKYIEAYGSNQAKYKVILFVIQLLIEANVKENPRLMSVVEKFIKEITAEDAQKDIVQKSLDVIAAIVSEAALQKRSLSSNSIISQAVEYINNNFTKNISLEEMSKFLNVSPYYFSKIFKKSMGINFKKYLIKLKIEHAQKLLKETNMPIKEIAYEVGFDDPNYFIKAFKKYTGTTPATLRSSQK
ncbi:response regulator transcription factor [Caldicellulosiruptor naganoensis]|uniref:Helix-turn-helix domain-containing protein n=1 Tax=Caldicellulosiruptor naganoensis TaxID=29324 RepID=A0ABY7BFB8_9FIRM|nr:helix-turn-helix domain-containing protein [Caldicellulosiruptor naganoensis]WAM31495.1 helix-turn-helix domain-containing protein [Caldicellulosiruptor naganoensis]